MKIHLVSLEDGITATGFRKVAAYVERLNPDTRTFYVGTQRYRSMWKSFVRKMGEGREFGDARGRRDGAGGGEAPTSSPSRR